MTLTKQTMRTDIYGVGVVPASNDEVMPVIDDEFALLDQWLPMRGASILDLGCGKAVTSRRMLAEGEAAWVVGMDTDKNQMTALQGQTLPEGLTLVEGGAQAIPFDDASFDIVTMFKSLHHVPVDLMDTALQEVARVLKPNGLLYVSEPVYAGELNEVVRLFHDEGVVRAEAVQAMKGALDQQHFVHIAQQYYNVPTHFRDFDAFRARHIEVTHTHHIIDTALMQSIEQKFSEYMGPDGAAFDRPMRVNVFKKV